MSSVRHTPRRGVTAVLAMVYLLLFSTLAIGFYAATSTSVQIVHNEQHTVQALLAAESGLEFLGYQIGQIVVPPTTTPSQLFGFVASKLRSQLENTGNVSKIKINADTIDVPEPGRWVQLPNGKGEFRAVVFHAGEKLRVRVYGRYNSAQSQRAVQMSFGLAERASDIFNFGVASKGAITTGGSSRIRGATDPAKGSVLSTSMSAATPVSIGGQEISGDISIANPTGTVYVAPGTSVGGTTDPALIASDHIHVGVAAPEFPYVDTNVFLPFVKNTYSGGNYLENVRIPANTNPTFSGATINGIVYIEQPNVVSFKGNTTINGIVVVDSTVRAGTPSSNLLDFGGNITANSVATLTASQVPSLNATELTEIQKLTGAFVLAPNFTTTFTGSFGMVSGSIIGDRISMTGNAGGTVMGSVIATTGGSLTLNGNSEIIIASTGTTDYPPGVRFSEEYHPLGDTYEEVKP